MTRPEPSDSLPVRLRISRQAFVNDPQSAHEAAVRTLLLNPGLIPAFIYDAATDEWIIGAEEPAASPSNPKAERPTR